MLRLMAFQIEAYIFKEERRVTRGDGCATFNVKVLQRRRDDVGASHRWVGVSYEDMTPKMASAMGSPSAASSKGR